MQKLINGNRKETIQFKGLLSERVKIVSVGHAMKDSQVYFYYQRPPTIRIQPGPSTRGVKVHSDSMHENREDVFGAMTATVSDKKIVSHSISKSSKEVIKTKVTFIGLYSGLISQTG